MIGLEDDLFCRLAQSNFRSRFHLTERDYSYIQKKGVSLIRQHAYDFVEKRLAPAVILNDGSQTPMKGHPVFVAQHATATCCRSCLEKWHGIKKNQVLTKAQKEYIVHIIMKWIQREISSKSFF